MTNIKLIIIVSLLVIGSFLFLTQDFLTEESESAKESPCNNYTEDGIKILYCPENGGQLITEEAQALG